MSGKHKYLEKAKYGKERKISGNSVKERENRNPTRLSRMSGEDTKLWGEKREMGERIGWGTTTTRPTMEDDEWR